MPEAEEVTGPTPEQANTSNRDAILAKSNAALKAAIEAVKVDPVANPKAARAAPVAAKPPQAQPAPRAEVVEAPEAVEAAEEPADAPVAAQEVAPVEAEAPVAVEKASRSLERKARQTMAARRDKQALDAATQRLTQLEAENKAAQDILTQLRGDPVAALQKLGHDPAQLVPNWLSQVAKPEQTPEQKAAEAQQKRLDDLEKFRQQTELSQRQQAATTQIAAYQQKCADAIADKTAFEYVHRDGGTEALYSYILDTYNVAKAEQAGGRMTEAQVARIANTPPAAFAKQMEADLRRKFGTTQAAPAAVAADAAPAARIPRGVDPSYVEAARNVRGSRSIRQRQQAAKLTADEEPSTITARSSAVRTVPGNRRVSTDELVKRAVAELDRQNRAASGRR